MRKHNLLAVVLTLFLLVPASITWAQTISSQKGLTTAIFPTQNGNIKMYFPEKIRPGDAISGTILCEPTGKNAKQIEKSLAELTKYSVSVDGNKILVPAKPELFKWLVPKDRQVSSPIELLNVSGVRVAELSLKISEPGMNVPQSSQQCIIPTHALTGSPVTIRGTFDGDASNTICTLDNQPLQALTESPRECNLFYPADATGIKTLNVQEYGKQSCSQKVSSVQMNVSTGKLNLQKGEKTYIDVSIIGLQSLPDTALLSLNNISTGIVTMQPSNNLAIPLAPDSVATGSFNKRFNIQSIRTGSFTVNVNLDLPDQTEVPPPFKPKPGEYPPTQPQPPDNPQPKDTTVPQPPRRDSTTVAQCPTCNCSCEAGKIKFESKKGTISSYSVSVNGGCSGEFGDYPPCNPCDVIKPFIYDWTISFSADKPVAFVGGRNGPGVSINNPDNGSFSLSVIVTINCSKGSCTCKAVTSYLATNPPPPDDPPGKCDCNVDCKIKKLESKCGEANFEAVVNAECKGTNPKIKCTVASITYLWFIEDDGKSVAAINGSATGTAVKVKTGNAGSYTIFLKVTVTCSNGSVCEKICKLTETVTECILELEWCAGTSIKVKAVGYYPKESLLKDMRPGELIGFTVYGEDNDVPVQKSDCNGIIGYTPHPPVPDEVNYSWEVISFGKSGGELLQKAGNSNVYHLPYCMEQYPVKDEIVVRLNNKGGKATDEEVVVVFTIELSIEVNGYNDELSIGQGYAVPLRTIVATITHRVDNKPEDIVCPDIKPCCTALLPAKWEKGIERWVPPDIDIKVEYTSDKFPDNLVLLNVNEVLDYDNLIIKCFDPVSGKIIEKKISSIPDNIDYTWTVVSGRARLIYGKGRSVALIHNYGATNTVTVKCVITESNIQFTDGIPIILFKTISPRQKPMAIVALGNINYQINDVPFVDKIKLPHKHSELEEVVTVAANKYSAAGYTSKIFYTTKSSIAEDFFKNPKIQAVMLMGHGAVGTMELSDGSTFDNSKVGYSARTYWMCREPDVNLILHPTVREMSLMGCDTHHEKWPERFFRLEKYRAFRGPVYSTSYSSRIVTQIKNMKPTPPRIAPPE